MRTIFVSGQHNYFKTQCKWGHPFDRENTYIRPGGRGSWRRQCRECTRYYNRLWYRKKRLDQRVAQR